MKTITPVSVWYNGASTNATAFRLYVIHDNLEDTAQFYYELLASSSPVTNGNLTMDGTDYEDFVDNQYAWGWAASQLGLTII